MHSLSAAMELTSVQDVPPCTFSYSKLVLDRSACQSSSDLLVHCHWLSVFSCRAWEIRAQKIRARATGRALALLPLALISSWFVDHHDFGRLQQLHTRGTSESAQLMAVPRSSHSCSLWSRLRPSASHGPSGGYGRQYTAFNCSQLEVVGSAQLLTQLDSRRPPSVFSGAVTLRVPSTC